MLARYVAKKGYQGEYTIYYVGTSNIAGFYYPGQKIVRYKTTDKTKQVKSLKEAKMFIVSQENTIF